MYLVGNIPDVTLARAYAHAEKLERHQINDDADIERNARELQRQENSGGQDALKELFDAAREARVNTIFIELEFYPNDKCEIPDAIVGEMVNAFIVALGKFPLTVNRPQARLIVARTKLGKEFLYHLGWVCVDTPGDVTTGARGENVEDFS